MASNHSLDAWVEESARLTRPKDIHWCDGSEAEVDRLIGLMLDQGDLVRLSETRHPNCYLHRSHPTDVSRTEHLTFICAARPEDVGPTNNWMDPQKARTEVGRLFDGAMRGRTMYVVPYLMGPAGSAHSRVGVEITDSPYVVANMRIMTRMGRVALDHLKNAGEFSPGLHSLGDLSPDRRFIVHFPEERLIWSIGSGYGGNALLGKKCFALRIASWIARQQGWLAEHMLILGLEDPEGRVTYMAAAFPSACGKTNLAMLASPLAHLGYKVWTVGDDIAWMRVGPDGRLWAINPEAGFFGVAPGTNSQSNPNAIAALNKNSIFTNVGLTPDLRPWWEGISEPLPAGTIDWRGRSADPNGADPVAHPNARYTAPARQCPSISPEWESPEGVPISAILFGGRRRRVAPLVYQSFDWPHGVFVGASMASETTAAATGQVGVTRRDPMAMLPFCGYNMGDYFGHWLSVGARMARPPLIFHVNWFRQSAAGIFLWPGFGENVRVLRWILDRVRGGGEARETEIGYVPTPAALDLDGLGIPPETVRAALEVDRESWVAEISEQREFFQKFGDRTPARIWEEHRRLAARLKCAVDAPPAASRAD
ncbi:MAG: phosphoenolpyruvate carboxykinase [Candidatus Lindowbacteria bacterium RIFCSPLOWO2_12_FULL_62_27]|nr:MAG: phosphoenolpyruvate carboxykinase [Candidatus Lindowbacteria bacterium RIFCSPLOWO2_12_FULL_62_27]OGH63985.1 MAG: phosphoenolpyruvate carboxykinase [Candidatus Lindowbacteria bacterium RIFCSPLOWO2_02_FULL_62_12]